MVRKIILTTIGMTMGAHLALAQDAEERVFVQLEAHRSLQNTESRLQFYAADLQDVNGFSLGAGWYGIALGPYSREDAEQVLQVYRREGYIPSDSYIAPDEEYRQQIWPVGANVIGQETVEVREAPEAVGNSGVVSDAAPEGNTLPSAAELAEALNAASGETAEEETQLAQADVAPEPAPVPVPAPEPEPEEVDETPREASASERLLSREERMDLQIALKWAGFYTAGIDGAFGRGTRASMAAWQDANGFEPTGILTTKQRAALIGQYNAVLDGLGLRTVADDKAGIQMKLPTEVVAFTKYEAPFAHYDASGDLDARVLLISQEGDRANLFGLYDIMQTLEIVPSTGPREKKQNSFVLVGENDRFVSHTEASVENGQIKGFTLIWPAGDEERRTRLLEEMGESFTRLDGVLDAGLSASEQSIDLVSGLEIRKPKNSAAGFYVDTAGHVATSLATVEQCGRITIEGDYEAVVKYSDPALGIAILEPKAQLAPVEIADLQMDEVRLQSDVAVAGFPYGGVLPAPTVTYGTLADVKGLNGEETIYRLNLAAMAGDVGGPVFDGMGAVMGMLLPASGANGQTLPDGASFALDAEALADVLKAAGVAPKASEASGVMGPDAVARRAANMTVLVGCWE